MKVYFYHTQDLNRIYKAWNEGHFPGHFLYGATHLPRYGVDVVMHKHKNISNRLQRSLYVAWRVFTCREHFDAIYATRFNGLEIPIFLRALHLYRKPIILWHHQPVVKADNAMREMLAQIFYRGIDHMFFFSQRLIDESLKSSKAREERMQVAHWGPDLEYYDRLMQEYPVAEHKGFISTGKEKRDMPTLIRAFSATGSPLDIYIAYNACGDNYLEILNDLRPSANIHIHFIKGLIPHELAQKVWAAKYVAICCQDTNYTVGLTTLVEALALGMPIIATRNVTFPFNIEKEGVGIIVPYYDSVAWEKAIRYITTDDEAAETMGRKARQLAERLFNLDNCTAEVAEAIKKFEKTNPQPANEPQPVQTAEAEQPEPLQPAEPEPLQSIEPELLKPVEPVQIQKAEPKPQPTVEPQPTFGPQPTVEPQPIFDQQPSAKPEREPEKPASSFESHPQQQAFDPDGPIINTAALRHRINTITADLRRRFSSLEQLKVYLPTKEEMDDLWDKTKKLASRVGDKVKNIIMPK